MRIVLDINVVVSGLHIPDGAPGRILDCILAGQLHLLYDDRILAEYSDVLVRPKIGFSQDLAKAVTRYLRHPNDCPFAEVARSKCAEALVAGSQEHFARLEAHGIRVLSPSALLDLLRQE